MNNYIKVGDTFNLSCGSIATILKLKGERSEIITTTGYKTNALNSKIKSGNVKDRLKPIVCGLGFLGIGKYDTYCKSNKAWNNMFHRAYRLSNLGLVNIKWHDYQVFAKHYEEFYIEGYQLDKDLLFYGNKEYSSDKCIYVPVKINNIFRSIKSNGLLYGVMKCEEGYTSSIQPRKKELNEVEAHKRYWNDKYKKVLHLSKEYPEFKFLLMNYFESLFNDKYNKPQEV